MSGAPTSRPGAFVVSLDFELHWGVRDLLGVEEYRETLLGVRAAVPAMLDLFRAYEVHATWAVVGLLLCDGRRELLDALPARRPVYRERRLSPYGALGDLGASEADDPFHFAPSLVRRIADTPGQEIGTHTFSHYYCLEDGQTPGDFRADLEAAVAVMCAKLGRMPRSIVFPRNQVAPAHLAVCGDLGLVAYRGNPAGWAYRARRRQDESGPRRAVRLADAYLPLGGSNAWRPAPTATLPVDVPASRYLCPFAPLLRVLDGLRLRRIVADLTHAARRGLTYHLWWHPHDFGRHLAENLRILEHVLRHVASLRLRYGMESLGMAEAAARVLEVRATPAIAVGARA